MTELSWVQPYLAIGPRPDWPAWAALEQAGVSLIIDLNDDPVERRRAQSVGLEYRGLKVPDPTGLEDFLACFPRVHEWIERERTRGGRVYLHCTAGVYRSPTFAIGHLMARGEPGEKARSGQGSTPTNMDQRRYRNIRTGSTTLAETTATVTLHQDLTRTF